MDNLSKIEIEMKVIVIRGAIYKLKESGLIFNKIGWRWGKDGKSDAIWIRLANGKETFIPYNEFDLVAEELYHQSI